MRLLVLGGKWTYPRKSDTPNGTCYSTTSSRREPTALKRLWRLLVTPRQRTRHLEEESYRDMRPNWRGSRVCAKSTHRYMRGSMPKYRRSDAAKCSMNSSREHFDTPFLVGTRLTWRSRKSSRSDWYLLTSPECSWVRLSYRSASSAAITSCSNETDSACTERGSKVRPQ
jgi:hypothetical protein